MTTKVGRKIRQLPLIFSLSLGIVWSLLFFALPKLPFPFHEAFANNLGLVFDSAVKSTILFLPICLFGRVGLGSIGLYLLPISFSTYFFIVGGPTEFSEMQMEIFFQLWLPPILGTGIGSLLVLAVQKALLEGELQ